MVTRPIYKHDYIAIGEIAVYGVYLLGGIYLCTKHGVSKAVGFRSLVVLSLARLIGSSLFLATRHDANNQGLYIGWAVTNSVGLGPLVLMLVGLLGRAFGWINRPDDVVLPPRIPGLVQLLMLAAMLLVIIGGTKSDYAFDGTTFVVHYNMLSKVGMGIMVIVVIAVFGQFGLAVLHRRRVPAGERRILAVVAIALPFVTVRLLYGCVNILTNHKTGIWVYLGASAIMEMIACLVVEIAGFSLKKIPNYKQGNEMLGANGNYPNRY